MPGSADSSDPSEPSDPSDANGPDADGGWDGWDASAADDDALFDEGRRTAEGTGAGVVEIIRDPAPADGSDGTASAADAPLAALLSSLRALPGPCAPPIGEGAFDILYASAREIVVWFISAKDGVAQKEVAIPTRLAGEAWALLRRGDPVDEAALRAITSGASGASWLLALFAQLPSVEVRNAANGDANGDADGDGHAAITLLWRGDDTPHTSA